MSDYDWDRIEKDVVQKIRILHAVTVGMGSWSNRQAKMRDKIIGNLIRPNLKLLADFCANVSVDVDAEDVGTADKKEN